MASIELKNIHKKYPDGTQVLSDINMQINDGEFFILVGPSGCGKSTLLNMIVGLEDISAGELLLNGKLINQTDPKERNMAMVFQSYALYPHMSVRENIAFPLKMAKVNNTVIDERVAETAEILGLSSLLDKKPRNLSGGQRQRVAMGRAIIRRPAAFLLDEPLSNLDARLRVQMRTEIAQLQKRLKTTIIYVTHDQTEAMTLGDRVAVMNGGVVQQIDSPQMLYYKPCNQFVAGFIGSPAMNFVPGEIKQNRLCIPALNCEFELLSSYAAADGNKSIVVGMRPEHIHIMDNANSERQDLEIQFHCTVDLIECLGADSLIYFQTPP